MSLLSPTPQPDELDIWEAAQIQLQFFRAAEDGNVDQLRHFLSLGGQVNQMQRGKTITAFLSTLRYHHEQAIRFLAQHIDLDAPIQHFGTPLLYCIREHLLDSAKTLLSLGASPLAIDSEGYPPIIEAIRFNHPDIVSLLAPLPDVASYISNLGETPLMIAAARYQQSEAPEMIKALLPYSHANAQDGLGQTALMISVRLAINAQSSYLLLPHTDLTLRNQEGFNVLDLCEQNPCQTEELTAFKETVRALMEQQELQASIQNASCTRLIPRL